MQADGESNFPAAVRKAFHLVCKPRCGEGDVAFGDGETVLRTHLVQKAHHVVVVVQRLSAAHKDDVGDGTLLHAAALRRVDRYHLTEDLGKMQIPHQPVRTRRAESTVHPAPYLSGDAEGVAVVVGHENALYEVAVKEGEKILLAAVTGGIDSHDGHGVRHILLIECGAQGF